MFLLFCLCDILTYGYIGFISCSSLFSTPGFKSLLYFPKSLECVLSLFILYLVPAVHRALLVVCDTSSLIQNSMNVHISCCESHQIKKVIYCFYGGWEEPHLVIRVLCITPEVSTQMSDRLIIHLMDLWDFFVAVCFQHLSGVSRTASYIEI